VYVITSKCKQLFFHSVKYINFRAKKEYLRGILLHYFIFKKSAAEVEHRILLQTYGEHALSETTDWFRHFKNNDFYVKDKEHSGATKKSLKTKNWRHYFMKTHIRR